MTSSFEGEVFLEDLSELQRTGFAVCAFFTPDGGYERYARRLALSCGRHGLPYSIWRAPCVHRSISLRGSPDLCFTKSSFIRFSLDRLDGCDVAYLDVDTLVIAHPSSLFEARETRCDFAIYNWLNDPHNEAYLPTSRQPGGTGPESDFYLYYHRIAWRSSEYLACSGPTQYYAATAAARALLNHWQETIAANPGTADDDCLNLAHNSAADAGLRRLWLSKAYARYPWWPHVEPVVLHPDVPVLTQPFAPVGGPGAYQRFLESHCMPNDAMALFPVDGGVDTRTGITFRIGHDQRPVAVGHYPGRFWIYREDEGLAEAAGFSRP